MAVRSLRNARRVQGFSFQRNANGEIPVSELDRAAEELQRITSVLNGGLSFGDGSAASLAGNFKAQFVDVVFPAAANTLHSIPHGLGVVPVGVIPFLFDRAANLYHTEFRTGWTPNTIQLYCDTASTKVKLLIVA